MQSAREDGQEARGERQGRGKRRCTFEIAFLPSATGDAVTTGANTTEGVVDAAFVAARAFVGLSLFLATAPFCE
jgi:hypothetical protein